MSRNRHNQPPIRDLSGTSRDLSGTSRRQPDRSRGQLPLLFRLVVSLLVAWHVTAVFMAPLSIPPTSPTIASIAQQPPMQWYLDALYLNHGYHFFAPDPGNGHLIRYQMLDETGNVIKEAEFPNTKDQWPRLRYHRYFMLADQCGLPAETEEESNRWQQNYLTNYARQILREHDGGAAVRVQRIVHVPLGLPDALEGKTLTDPGTYHAETEVTQRRQDLDLPPPNQSGAWNQNRHDVANGWQGRVR